ncbi:MAG: O-acetylhomoserine aminocarboxypropyltransferase/cysteine synthase [Tissierellia bacterium]|nr:O-acetylhomoserine aminocarboxypropyltransferase/cysteine synthase [Tissierellia bacterium]
MKERKYSAETLCAQAGYDPKNKEPRITPIVQSTTYNYDTSEDLARVFSLSEGGYMYSRLGNPTVAVLEEKIAALEGGVKGVATSSGMAASFFSVINITRAGQNIIATSNVYGGTMTLFTFELKNMGIEVRFVSERASKEEILASCDENTRLIFAESLSNPSLDVLDFEEFAGAAKEAKIPLIVDNTFPSPFLCRPLDHGANIVVHSTSKYIDGHGSCIGGMIIDGGNFDWKSSGKFPELTEPDESYHGVVYADSFGKAAYGAKCQAGLLRNFGSTMSPFNAFLTNIGTETLHLRMERHSNNALKVAEYLENHTKVDWVNYPKLKSSKYYDLANKYLPKGAAGVVSFGVKGGADLAKKFLDNLGGFITIATHVGDLKTMALHPASTTHSQLSEEEMKAGNVLPNLVRLNIGIENVDDIISELERAFEGI